ncbi:MAG: aromatic ring-hydroxylating dioxygenase subunit alpha [Pigmentiphaga sp.]|uniref:aromatic ring-hydroxylating dioxygenase subunit alpha n=1 Tax=Pigmentiphaga sp. TaxID=1977564 RepID=UPI0029A145DC|nr:aromatic ring-hydroxylating dioxygenase subunit alpha [Pigmentiphaga sp.]MDX3904658.1 aromatic ring-hydroxylating dioxygenase subunit alpha [Pigmentiphaga sp.]
MFLRNQWYAAARGGEVGRSLLRRKILNEPIVMYRTLDGQVAAIEDRCCHRHVPLSIGKLVEDRVQCAYHGLEFDRRGCCVYAPGQEKLSANARVKAYVAVEKWQLVWLWMGDPERADESLIPDFSVTEQPGWAALGETLHLDCNYLLAIDNLLDLSHIAYVHARTIGTIDVARTPVQTVREGDAVIVSRWMQDVPPPPMFVKLGGFTGNIDRWQIARAAAPCYVWLDVGGAAVGTGALEGRRDHAFRRWNLNCITPETETSSHLFWTEVRNFGLDDPAVGESLRAQMALTLAEDAEVLAMQQQAILDNPDAPEIDISFDAGAIRFRRMIERKLAEQEAQAISART